MRRKKIVVPIVSLVIMMGSMVGCSVVKDTELLNLINSGSSVTIELAEPSYSVEVKGEETEFKWTQLDKLETHNKGFRQGIDEIFNINIVTESGENGKNGVLFVDAEGNRKGNAALVDALRNKAFVEKYWEDAKVKKAIGDLASEVYTDAGESEVQSIVASINAYYNIFSDRENPDSFNFNESLTREDFYSAVYRSENGVEPTLRASKEFESAVGGETKHTRFAGQVADYGYLPLENKSLDENSYTGAISRAEAAYLLVNMHFEEDFKNADVKSEAFADTKNGGDLALKLKFKEEDKESKEIVEKDRWQAFTLAYMVQNPDKGLQEDLYKAMVVAKAKNIITSSDSRWDEPLSKGEAILMIMNTHLAKNKVEGYVSTEEYGNMVVEEVADEPVVEAPMDEENMDPDEMGIVSIDPDTMPENGAITYREIREGVENSYKAMIINGYSKEEAMKDAEMFAQQLGASIEELNSLQGYVAIGETKPATTRPTASTETPSTPSESKPSTPSQPSNTGTEGKIVVDGVAYPVSEHGYAMTPWDTDGNGRNDDIEDNYANTDGTVSSPEGTPNPFDMP